MMTVSKCVDCAGYRFSSKELQRLAYTRPECLHHWKTITFNGLEMLHILRSQKSLEPVLD